MATVRQDDLYTVLGVDEKASQDEIRKAYRKLAQKYHPDKASGDKAAEARMKEINAAYDTLKNPEKRKQYDQMRAMGGGYGGNPFGQGFDPSAFGFGGEGNPFEDIFGSIFGGRAQRRPRSAAQPGRDIQAHIRISLRDVLHGVKRRIQVPRQETCEHCHGNGAAPGSAPETCTMCNGSGQMQTSQGFMFISRTCSRCHGTGQVIPNPCSKCNGHGRVNKQREVEVSIPKGVETGMRLRLTGEGEAGANGGPRGDLYVLVEVIDDPEFDRDGSDVLHHITIPFYEAILGAKVKVPTLEGSVELAIPEGTQPDAQLRLRGLGLPGIDTGRRGDQLVRVAIQIPTRLTKEQRRIIEDYQRLNG
ncbi:MAG: chaperone protein DnaJ [Candidatus Hydrogenedentota bacterium]